MRSYFWFHICITVLACGSASVIPNALKLQENDESARFFDSIKMIYCYFKYDVIPVECLPIEMQLFLKLTGKVPESRDTVATEFKLYTRKQSKQPETITNQHLSSWNLQKSTFNPNLKTKFITHGFIGADADWALEMKDAFLAKEDCNVFVVNWDGGDGPLYPQAYANVRVVGFEIGLFVSYLQNTTKLRPQNVHLIGHSLGAHASGFGGKTFHELNREKIGRITGLDPAGPGFYDLESTERLDVSDALFVDAIHTNMGNSFTSGFGIEKQLGHLDFYPNGGEDQPGCEKVAGEEIEIGETTLKFALTIFVPFGPAASQISHAAADTVHDVVGSVCSHGRAYELFTASIKNSDCKFASLECASFEDYTSGKCGSCSDHQCISMGYNADKYQGLAKDQTHRKFYLKTSDHTPFCTEKQ